MSLQGSIHKWSDGIGYGAFIPTERAYYNVRERRPSCDTTREYRRHNVTAGIDTHRSDISFGKTNESARGGTDGDSRAREATKSLTSGEVGPRNQQVSRRDLLQLYVNTYRYACIQNRGDFRVGVLYRYIGERVDTYRPRLKPFLYVLDHSASRLDHL